MVFACFQHRGATNRRVCTQAMLNTVTGQNLPLTDWDIKLEQVSSVTGVFTAYLFQWQGLMKVNTMLI